MARRTTKTAPTAYQMPRMQITADALPGVIMFSIASLSDGSLDPVIKQHKALAEYKLHGCPWILRVDLQECEMTDWEIDEVIATGVLPGIGLGWTAAMAAEASRAVDATVKVEASLSTFVALAASLRAPELAIAA